VNVAVMQCLHLAKRAGRRKRKDFKRDCIFSKQRCSSCYHMTVWKLLLFTFLKPSACFMYYQL